MLTCSCPDPSGDPGEWWYFSPEDFTMLQTKRRRRCSSCKVLMDIGCECLEFKRERVPYTELEEEICGEEIPMSSLYMCSKCGEIFLNLEAAGYCLSPTDNMTDCLHEYWDVTGFEPNKEKAKGG